MPCNKYPKYSRFRSYRVKGSRRIVKGYSKQDAKARNLGLKNKKLIPLKKKAKRNYFDMFRYA